MFRKMSYLLICTLMLSGCGITNKDNEIQANTHEVQEDFDTEDNLMSDNKIQSEGQTNEEFQENTKNTDDTSSLESESGEITNNNNEEEQDEKATQTKQKTDNGNSAELQNETAAKKYNLPEGFVYVDDVIPSVELEIRYYTNYNFVGEKIDGYIAPLAILTNEAADALKTAADKLAEDGYRIKIYDAYRPQKAVDHFVRWAQTDDASMKEIFYPSMEKNVLFNGGYISKKSRHTRGSTVDITVIDENNNEIDMGGYFDLLDTISNYDTDQITEQQHANREYLRNIMDEAGFDSIRTEWWHFQMREEPYPDTYFDFDIE